jgi:hypothetical protein
MDYGSAGSRVQRVQKVQRFTSFKRFIVYGFKTNDEPEPLEPSELLEP